VGVVVKILRFVVSVGLGATATAVAAAMVLLELWDDGSPSNWPGIRIIVYVAAALGGIGVH
jgi:hypothetical protein